MKSLVIYHGSVRKISNPVYGFGKSDNDYGLGFYCTLDKEAAREWACRNSDAGFVNGFLLNLDNLKLLDLTDDTKYSVLNWIAILLHYRKASNDFLRKHSKALKFLESYYIDLNNYDVIKGFRADDCYFRFPFAFLENKISLERLTEVYHLGNLGMQIVIRSRKAFNHLEFLSFEEVSSSYRYQYEERMNLAKASYEQIVDVCQYEKGTFLRDLVNNND